MSCRSDEKIVCPWCGAEMKRDWRQTIYGGPARKVWFKCENCRSISPIEWGENYDVALKTATEYALRRNTPILKPLNPMTLEEVKGASRAWIEVMAEGWDMQFVEMDKRSGGVVYQTPGSEQLYGVLYDDYGKTWRCWESKPTEEERSTAGWLKP